ncbi:MAG: terpene cyclase/mutase family protein [Thermoguttaceae bacterium]|nr:terpene cyclase/mutase family protein [Thermoguttaceae bacterium]
MSFLDKFRPKRESETTAGRPSRGGKAPTSKDIASLAELDDDFNPALDKILEEHDVVDRLRTLPIWLIAFGIQAAILVALALFSMGDKNKDNLAINSQMDENESLDMDDLDDDSLDVSDFDIDVEEAPEAVEQPAMSFTNIETAPDLSLTDAYEVDQTEIVQPVQTIPMAGALEGRLMGKGRLLKSGGGNDASERAVKAALKWLSEHQQPDGSWSFQNAGEGSGRTVADNAATAMAILPFLGAGNTPSKGEYKSVVARGIEFLLTNGSRSGNGYDLRDLGKDERNDSGRMYSHGLAAIALCEACAMGAEEHDKRYQALRSTAQQSLAFIQYAQDPVMGGWRYLPQEQPGDTSVTGWQVMALKSGSMGGLSVDPMVMKKAINFLSNQVAVDGGARYGYQDNHGGTDATTAIGLLCRLYLDWDPKNPNILRGADYLLRKGPDFKNAYYIYYATQVLHHIGGPRWTEWNNQVRDTLINSQVQSGEDAGSWAPGEDVYRGEGGRLYVTSLFCMTLEVYYRHMPLYAQTQYGDAETEDFPLD